MTTHHTPAVIADNFQHLCFAFAGGFVIASLIYSYLMTRSVPGKRRMSEYKKLSKKPVLIGGIRYGSNYEIGDAKLYAEDILPTSGWNENSVYWKEASIDLLASLILFLLTKGKGSLELQKVQWVLEHTNNDALWEKMSRSTNRFISKAGSDMVLRDVSNQTVIKAFLMSNLDNYIKMRVKAATSSDAAQ